MKNLKDLKDYIFILKVSLSVSMRKEEEGFLKFEMVRRIVSKYLQKFLGSYSLAASIKEEQAEAQSLEQRVNILF